MTAQMQTDQRLWTRELKAAGDVEEMVRAICQQVAASAVQMIWDAGVDEDTLGADAEGEIAADNHRTQIHDAAVRIVERLREVWTEEDDLWSVGL